MPGDVVGSMVTMTSPESAPAGIATCSAPSDEATIPPVIPTTAEVISMLFRRPGRTASEDRHREQAAHPET